MIPMVPIGKLLKVKQWKRIAALECQEPWERHIGNAVALTIDASLIRINLMSRIAKV